MKLAMASRGGAWYGPAPQGAGGLKSLHVVTTEEKIGPAPQGAGGLKCPEDAAKYLQSGPAPQGAGGLK